jgi:hypothetical protein
VVVVEKGVWHAMAAAPVELGYPGHAVIFETSGHSYDNSKSTKATINSFFFLISNTILLDSRSVLSCLW